MKFSLRRRQFIGKENIDNTASDTDDISLMVLVHEQGNANYRPATACPAAAGGNNIYEKPKGSSKEALMVAICPPRQDLSIQTGEQLPADYLMALIGCSIGCSFDGKVIFLQQIVQP